MSVAISPQTAIGPASYDALEKEYNKRESEVGGALRKCKIAR